MDMSPLIVITTPIFLPVAQAFGVDPVHFGVILILNLGIGLCTPPVGAVLFVGCAVGRIPIWQAVRTIWPFYGAAFVDADAGHLHPGAVALAAVAVPLKDSGCPSRQCRRSRRHPAGPGREPELMVVAFRFETAPRASCTTTRMCSRPMCEAGASASPWRDDTISARATVSSSRRGAPRLHLPRSGHADRHFTPRRDDFL